MSVPDPNLNFRAPEWFKPLIQLEAKRMKLGGYGTFIKVVVSEWIASQRAIQTLKTVGLQETLRRLAHPSPSWNQGSNEDDSGLGQTGQNCAMQNQT